MLKPFWENNKLWILVILFGIISLLSDFTYEGARSITGQFLKTLNTEALWVGISAGAGEFLGYIIRLPSGIIADRLKKYWEFVFTGYFINLFAVPLLAFAKDWKIAVFLIFLERIGKGIRTPSRDALLSYCAETIGRAKVFALHESMDQIGAVLGPLFITFLLFLTQVNYRVCFLYLGIPAIIVMILLFSGTKFFPFEKLVKLKTKVPEIKTEKFNKNFWFYVLGMSFVSAGIIDYPLIAYYFKEYAVFKELIIPFLYTMAMLSDAGFALILGYLYEKFRKGVLIGSIILSGIAPFLFFLAGHKVFIVFGVILWSIGIAMQESVAKAYLLNFLPEDKKATGFGIFHSICGLSWFIGSAVMGLLYAIDLKLLAVFSFLLHFLAMISLILKF
jgi:MFS family permease